MTSTHGKPPQTFTIQDTSGAHVTLVGYLVRQEDAVDVPPRETATGTEDELLAWLRETEQETRRAGKSAEADQLAKAVDEIIRLRAAAGPIFTTHSRD